MKKLLLSAALMSAPLANGQSTPTVLESGSKNIKVEIDGNTVYQQSIDFEKIMGKAYCRETILNPLAPKDEIETTYKIWVLPETFSYIQKSGMSFHVKVENCQDLTVSDVDIAGDDVEIVLYPREISSSIFSSIASSL